MARALPMIAFIMCISDKYKKEEQWENYIADCLWAPAVGYTFSDNDKPTLPRWAEMTKTKKKEQEQVITKESVKAQFQRLKR